jgi:ribonuclease P protein component
LSKVQSGWDLVIIARKDASIADYHQLEQSMHRLMRRAGIVDTTNENGGR